MSSGEHKSSPEILQQCVETMSDTEYKKVSICRLCKVSDRGCILQNSEKTVCNDFIPDYCGKIYPEYGNPHEKMYPGYDDPFDTSYMDNINFDEKM